MSKKKKPAPQNRNAGRDRPAARGNTGRNRALMAVLGGVLIVAVAVGAIAFLNRSPPVAGSPGFTISGTVSYAGREPNGRIYIQVADSSGEYNGLGTSIAAPGPYSVRNVPAGTYGLKAWMDSGDPETAVPNALSPQGSTTVGVKDGDVPGQDITVADPSPLPAPTPPATVGVAPGNGSALVQWSPPLDGNGNVLAQSYNVYFSTSSSVSPQAGTRKTVLATNNVFLDGLTDGTTYYFVVTAVLGGVESSPSAPVVSGAIGATAGTNTISGTISFPKTATGPMYAGVSGRNGIFFQRIANPVSPQSYRIAGVPGGAYVSFVIIDMNNNGIIDTGDLNKTNDDPGGGNTIISVGSDMAGVNETLLASNVLARVTTLHAEAADSPGSDAYSLQFEVGGNLKRPTKVELRAGANVPATTDMGGSYTYYHLFYRIQGKPKAGDSYVFAISYSDGTSEKVKVSVTGVLDSFAQNMTTSGEDRTHPTFGWSAPTPAPPEYTYLIQVGQRSIGREWSYPLSGNGMPSSQTSVPYNVDGSASLTSLQSGTAYDWLIVVVDANGNQAVYSTTYTP